MLFALQINSLALRNSVYFLKLSYPQESVFDIIVLNSLEHHRFQQDIFQHIFFISLEFCLTKE